MKNFMKKVGLVSVWDSFPVDFTHIHTDMVSTAVLDHFLMNERLIPLIEECRVLHRGDNLSRHSPVLLKLRVGDIPIKKKVDTSVPRRQAWNKATQENIKEYKEDLENKLENLPMPDTLSCEDPHCWEPTHSDDRDSIMLDILCKMI